MQHPPDSSPPLRVCDRCIRKKVKCNQARPTCSRCFELGETCTYTLRKRKPGPLRGSRRVSRSGGGRSSPENSLQRPQGSSGPESISGDHVSASSDVSPSASHQTQGGLRFPSDQVEYLLAAYFDLFQDASPIHSKELFFRRYQSSQCSEDLVSAMVTITAKLIGFTTENDGLDLDAGLDFLLSSSLLGEDLIGEAPSLDQFRKAYLLAFYEFHQFPGHLSWLRISRVSRMAYRIGLDRLDHIRTRYADWRVLSDEDIQEWRSLWWCIYRVDSYSNMASGTPYLIDDALINTSLSRSLAQAQATHSTQKLYLRPDAEQLSKLLLAAPSDPDTLLENIHNITVATVRQAGSLLRKHLLRSREKILAQVASIERLVATVRLALPAGWLSPRRNAFSNESHVAHHARLITIAHLRMAQLLLALASCDLQPQGADDDGNGGGGGKWRGSWQHVLEACQDIAAVAEQWDSAYCLAVDPAISLTIFTALIFLDLHRKTATVAMGDDHTNTFRPGIDHAITILHLQLRSFGQFWTIARLLRLSFDSFSQAVSGPLSSEHVALFLSRFEAPLHPRWLQFLSSAHVELAGCQ